MIYFSLAFEPVLWIYPLLLVAALSGLVITRRLDGLRHVFVVLLLMVLGAGLSAWQTQRVYTPILKKEIGPVDVSGAVHGIDVFADDGGGRLVLDKLEIEGLDPNMTPRRVRVKVRDISHIKIGQRVEMLAGLNPPSASVLPGGFDFQRYMFFQSIGGVGFSYGGVNVISDSKRSSAHSVMDSFRTEVARMLITTLGEDGGVAAALTVGHRAGITESDKEAMRASGLAHMLAISGLHIGLFFGAVFFFVRLALACFPQVALKYPIKKFAAVAAMVAALIYMFLAGATIPTQRAAMMMFLVFVALMIDRTPLSLRLVACAALVVLFISPQSLLTPSFQMSFSAVAALVAFYEAIRPWWRAWHKQAGIIKRAGLYLAGVCMTTLVATFATAPFALFHFQQLAVLSLAANILAMPVLAFVVMPLIVLFFILLPFGLGGLVLPAIGWGVACIVDIAHLVSGFEFSVFRVGLWPVSALICFSAFFVAAILLKGQIKVISFLPLGVFCLLIFTIKQPDILISSRADVIGVSAKDGSLLLSQGRKNKFTQEQWLQAFGLKDDDKAIWPKEGDVEDMKCGEGGCRLERNGYKVAFLRVPGMAVEDCQWADIVVAQDPVEECEAPHVLDLFQIFDAGAQAVYLEKPLRIKQVQAMRGQRPWVADTQ